MHRVRITNPTLSRRKNLKRDLRHALDKTSNEDYKK